MKKSELRQIIREEIKKIPKTYKVQGDEWVLINPSPELLKYFKDDPDQEDSKWTSKKFWAKTIEPLLRKHLGGDYPKAPKDNAFYEGGKIYLM